MVIDGYNIWYQDLIRFYRDLDFFVDGKFAGQSDLECLQILSGQEQDTSQEEYEKQIRLGRQSSKEDKLFSEVCFLAVDNTRVIWIDPEGVWQGENFYRNLLVKLGTISRKLFHPSDILEEWVYHQEKENSRIYVSFKYNNEHFTFETDSMGDFGQELFLVLVNELILHTGQKFRLYSNPGDWFIICQSDDEVRQMLKRGFNIQNPVFKPQADIDNITSNKNENWAIVWLYIKRGMLDYQNGYESKAWEQWDKAAKMGDKDLVYTNIAKLIEQNHAKYFF